MTEELLDTLFTKVHPLGPIAVSDRADRGRLKAIYEPRVDLHAASRRHPPAFIVGRRGSGKTALLLSREFDDEVLTIRLSTSDLFNHINLLVERLGQRSVLTVETVARLWELLLWAPIAVRLANGPVGETQPAFQTVWEETAPLRNVTVPVAGTKEDIILETFTRRLHTFINDHPELVSIDAIAERFSCGSRSWSSTISACRSLLGSDGLKVFVLVDSLEDIGEILERIRLTLRGLFHLVGRASQCEQYYRLQCCFPSELWPRLDVMSSNPAKDLEGRLVLRWRWHDLASACDLRLRSFLEIHYPELLERLDARKGGRPGKHDFLLQALLPETVVTPAGDSEWTLAYVLRHTQMLPRQVIYMFNECFARAIAESSAPFPTQEQVVSAVEEAEATLCPEVFSAHSFRYPDARFVTSRIVPRLPFRFSEGDLHQAYNQAGLKKAGFGYHDVVEMMTDCGIIGRTLGETTRYHKAEFAYTVEGQLILSASHDICLHPMFARQYSSIDIRPGLPAPKPVYPYGVPEGPDVRD